MKASDHLDALAMLYHNDATILKGRRAEDAATMRDALLAGAKRLRKSEAVTEPCGLTSDDFLDALYRIEALVKSDAAHIYEEVRAIIFGMGTIGSGASSLSEASTDTAQERSAEEHTHKLPLPSIKETT